MTKDEWKTQSVPVLTRVVTLEQKAEDDGLTDEERDEHDRLEVEWQYKYIKMLVNEVDLES